MREINIKLWRIDEFSDWSAGVNGRFHEGVPDEASNDLVEAALIVAAKSLMQASVNVERPKSAEATRRDGTGGVERRTVSRFQAVVGPFAGCCGKLSTCPNSPVNLTRGASVNGDRFWQALRTTVSSSIASPTATISFGRHRTSTFRLTRVQSREAALSTALRQRQRTPCSIGWPASHRISARPGLPRPP
jgi:hypothetical protein